PGRRTGPGTGPDRGQLFLVAGCEGQAGTARWNRGADRGFWSLLGPASTVAVTAGTMESQGVARERGTGTKPLAFCCNGGLIGAEAAPMTLRGPESGGLQGAQARAGAPEYSFDSPRIG